MKTQSTYEIVDLHHWGPENAETAFDLPAVDQTIIPAISYIATDDGVQEVPLLKNNHAGRVFAIKDAIWPLGEESAASNGKLFQVYPLRRPRVVEHLYGELSRSEDGKTVVLEHAEPTREIEEAIVVNLSSKYWGAQLLMFAALAAIKEAIGDRKIPLVRFPRTAVGEAEWEAIEMIFGYRPELINVLPAEFPVRIGKLWVASVPVEWSKGSTVFCDQLYQSYHKSLGLYGQPRPLTGGVYITRRDTRRGSVVNDAEIEEVAARHGLRPMTFAPLSIKGRMQEMANARVVMGAVGSNLFNVIFAPPGGWVVEFVPEQWLGKKQHLVQVPRIASAIGCRHIIVPALGTDMAEQFRDITVPINRLEAALDFIEQHDALLPSCAD